LIGQGIFHGDQKVGTGKPQTFLQCKDCAFSLCCLVENDGSKGFGMTEISVKSIFQWSVMVKLFRNFPSWPFHDEIYIANNFSTLEIKFLKK
jgi:hypothetical protein